MARPESGSPISEDALAKRRAANRRMVELGRGLKMPEPESPWELPLVPRSNRI